MRLVKWRQKEISLQPRFGNLEPKAICNKKICKFQNKNSLTYLIANEKRKNISMKNMLLKRLRPGASTFTEKISIKSTATDNFE